MSYKNFVEGSGDDKSGYGKLLFGAQQARRGGYSHLWVDTCCIEKFNSVELKLAITSMFH